MVKVKNELFGMYVKVKNELFGMYTTNILFARRICNQNRVYCFTFVLQFFFTNLPFEQTKNAKIYYK